MNEQRLRTHTLLKGVILSGFTLLLFKMLLSGNITYLIAPKMYPYLYFTTVVLFLLGVLQIFKCTSDKPSFDCECCEEHRPPKNTLCSLFLYSLFILPIVTGFLFADHILGSSLAKNRQIQYNTNSTLSTSNTATANNVDYNSGQVTENNQNTTTAQPQEMSQQDYNILQDTLEKKKSFSVNDKLYMPTMNIVQDNLDSFIGKEIETTGFVYREKEFTNKQIVIARYVITCCIADASVYGLMAKGDVTKLEEDTWVRVKGRLNKQEYHSMTIPVLDIQSIEKINQPKQPYVYDIGIKID
ncbi:TIGR03943 family protein [Heyndrickxia sporothermodurans]